MFYELRICTEHANIADNLQKSGCITEQIRCLDIGCGDADLDLALKLPELFQVNAYDTNTIHSKYLSQPNIHYEQKYVGYDNKYICSSTHPKDNNKLWYSFITAVYQTKQEYKTESRINFETVNPLELKGPFHLMKIDVDGPDYAILKTIEHLLHEWKTMVVCYETNYLGDGNLDDNVLYNTDRTFRNLGYQPVYIEPPRRYSLSVLPSKFIYDKPCQSKFGRMYQGDIIYVRDPFSEKCKTFMDSLSISELWILAWIYYVYELPDHSMKIMKDYNLVNKKFEMELYYLACKLNGWDRSDYIRYVLPLNTSDEFWFTSSV